MGDKIVIQYVGDAKQLKDELDEVASKERMVGDEATSAGKKADAAMDSTAKHARGLSIDMNKLAVAVGSAFAVQKILDFGRELQNIAVRMETTAQRMKVVFGDAADSVAEESKKMASQIGLSANEFELMATKAGDVLVPLGLARKDAAKTSTEIVKLAGALSEFSAGEVDTKQAVDAITKALIGEREALKGLGVVFNEQDVATRLAAKGQKNLEGQALATARAMASFEIIMERSSDAQTFFSKNSDSLARSVSEQQARIQTLREEMASKLEPVIRKVNEVILTLLENISAEDILNFAKAVGVLASAFVAAKLTNRITGIIGGLRGLTKGMGLAQIAIKGLSKAVTAFGGPIGIISGLVGAAATAFGLFGGSAEETEKEVAKLSVTQTKLNDITDKTNKNIEKEQGELKILFDRLKKTNAGSAERSQLLDEVNDKYGLTLQNLSDESEFAKQIESAYKGVVEQIREKITLQANEERIIEILRRQAEIQGQLNTVYTETGENLLAAVQASNMFGDAVKEGQVTQQEFDKAVEEGAKRNAAISQIRRAELEAEFNELEALANSIGQSSEEILKKTEANQKQVTNNARREGKTRVADFQKFEQQLEKIDEDFAKNRSKRLQDQLNDEQALRTKAIIESVFDEDMRQRKLLELEVEFAERRLNIAEANTEGIAQAELDLAQKRDDLNKNTAEAFKRQAEEIDSFLNDSSKKTDDFIRQNAELTRDALITVGNTILDIAKGISDDSLNIAIVQVLLNQAVAASEAIRAAVAAGAAAGPAAPIVTPGLIFQLLGITLGAFAQVQTLIDQAENQKSQSDASRPRFASGVIMVSGDGSSTGDIIPSYLSPGESVINARATSRNYDELLAINSGTFDSLVRSKYIIPALEAAYSGNMLTVDGGFDPRPLIENANKRFKEQKKQHREMMKKLDKNNAPLRARKWWYNA